jgi:cell wall-associated NlpC family hydrolase
MTNDASAGGLPCLVRVEVSTGWASPSAPRDIDAPAIAETPDLPAWLHALDAAGKEARLDLHARTVTQFVAGEPVLVVEEAGDWVRIVAPWQPSPLDPRGYPAWVPTSHVTQADPGDPARHSAGPGAAAVAPDPVAILEAARAHLGLAYLWGGTTPYGLDCSGLVHYSYRRAGVVVPRDAHPQYEAAEPVPLGEERPGDLYFFARDDGYVFHVGFVSAEHTLLHAPETGRGVEEGPMNEHRMTTLFAAGRFLG